MHSYTLSHLNKVFKGVFKGVFLKIKKKIKMQKSKEIKTRRIFIFEFKFLYFVYEVQLDYFTPFIPSSMDEIQWRVS